MLTPKIKTATDLIRSPLVWLSLVAGVLYSSWPWGFVLDPVVGRSSLASGLEAPHHPYNWLFIAMDVMTGLVLAGIGIYQLRKHPHRTARVVVISYLIFGILVAVAALTPLVCDPTTQSCGPLLHNTHALIHGFASIASVSFLWVALVVVTINSYRLRVSRVVLVTLSVILLAWAVFATASISQIIWHMHDGHNLQYFFITICSLSIIAVVTVLESHALQPVSETTNP